MRKETQPKNIGAYLHPPKTHTHIRNSNMTWSRSLMSSTLVLRFTEINTMLSKGKHGTDVTQCKENSSFHKQTSAKIDETNPREALREKHHHRR
jgi:hypothetical protein